MKFLSYDLLWINVFSQQKKPPHSSGDQGWVIKVYETQVNAVPGLQKVPANVQGPNAARYLGEGTFWWIQSYFISTIYTYHRSCVSDNAQVLHNCTKIAVQKACNKWILFRTSEMAQRKHWPGERWFSVERTSPNSQHSQWNITEDSRPRSWSMESIKSTENRPSRVDRKIID